MPARLPLRRIVAVRIEGRATEFGAVRSGWLIYDETIKLLGFVDERLDGAGQLDRVAREHGAALLAIGPIHVPSA